MDEEKPKEECSKAYEETLETNMSLDGLDFLK